MHRRQFIKTTTTLATAPIWANMALLSCARKSPKIGADEDFYRHLIRLNDKQIPKYLASQERDSAHRWIGAMVDGYGIHSVPATGGVIKMLAGAFTASESEYHRSETLLGPLQHAAQYLLNAQRPDGTIDLYTTNFNSPPDTGFVIENVSLAYTILQEMGQPALESLLKNLQEFILRAGEALTAGGIHTPNHRWVVCMALARIHALFPNDKYIRRIDQWLNEKIDIDPDGQYSEKSAAIYSPLTNRCLITVARLLGRPELLEPVRKNLDMTLYYVHSDGEIATEASKRQDQYQRGSMAPYHYPYRFMALHDGNGQFAAMTRKIVAGAGESLAGDLPFFLEDPSLLAPLPTDQSLPENYAKIFAHSNLARIRRGSVSATILAKNPTFFSFHKGAAALEAVRLASAFFGKGQFEGDALQAQDGEYVMKRSLEGPYYQPFPVDKLPGDGDWEKMDREIRPQSEVQYLESSVCIREENGRFDLTISIHETDRVPVAIELAFRHGGELRGVTRLPSIENAYLLEKGFGEYQFQGNVIRFGPGLAEHRWTQLRGALPKLNAQCVYLTGFTPFEITLKIS